MKAQGLCYHHLSSAGVDAADLFSLNVILPLSTVWPIDETNLLHRGSSSVVKDIKTAVFWSQNLPRHPFKVHSENIAFLKLRYSNFYHFCIRFLFIEREQNMLHIYDTKTESIQCPLQPISSKAQRPQTLWGQ